MSFAQLLFSENTRISILISRSSLTYYIDLYFPYLNIVSIYDVKIMHWIMA